MALENPFIQTEFMSSDLIARAQGNYEPQRTNNGMIVIDGLPGGDGASEIFRLSISTFPLPKQPSSSIAVQYMNSERKVVGRTTTDDLDIVLTDYCDKSTALMLWAWRCQVYNPWTEQNGLAHFYKKTATAYLFGPEGSFLRAWEMHGVFPLNMDPGEIDMAGEEKLNITLTLSIDKAILLADTNPGDRRDILENPDADKLLSGNFDMSL